MKHHKYRGLGLAKGGDVMDETTVVPDSGYGKIVMIKNKGGRIGYADGGDVEEKMEPMEMDEHEEGMDHEMMEVCAEELMDALEKKDKQGILDAIKAIVLSCRG